MPLVGEFRNSSGTEFIHPQKWSSDSGPWTNSISSTGSCQKYTFSGLTPDTEIQRWDPGSDSLRSPSGNDF